MTLRHEELQGVVERVIRASKQDDRLTYYYALLDFRRHVTPAVVLGLLREVKAARAAAKEAR